MSRCGRSPVDSPTARCILQFDALAAENAKSYGQTFPFNRCVKNTYGIAKQLRDQSGMDLSQLKAVIVYTQNGVASGISGPQAFIQAQNIAPNGINQFHYHVFLVGHGHVYDLSHPGSPPTVEEYLKDVFPPGFASQTPLTQYLIDTLPADEYVRRYDADPHFEDALDEKIRSQNRRRERPAPWHPGSQTPLGSLLEPAK